jgi:hypothetical protein
LLAALQGCTLAAWAEQCNAASHPPEPPRDPMKGPRQTPRGGRNNRGGGKRSHIHCFESESQRLEYAARRVAHVHLHGGVPSRLEAQSTHKWHRASASASGGDVGSEASGGGGGGGAAMQRDAQLREAYAARRAGTAAGYAWAGFWF